MRGGEGVRAPHAAAVASVACYAADDAAHNSRNRLPVRRELIVIAVFIATAEDFCLALIARFGAGGGMTKAPRAGTSRKPQHAPAANNERPSATMEAAPPETPDRPPFYVL